MRTGTPEKSVSSGPASQMASRCVWLIKSSASMPVLLPPPPQAASSTSATPRRSPRRAEEANGEPKRREYRRNTCTRSKLTNTPTSPSRPSPDPASVRSTAAEAADAATATASESSSRYPRPSRAPTTEAPLPSVRASAVAIETAAGRSGRRSPYPRSVTETRLPLSEPEASTYARDDRPPKKLADGAVSSTPREKVTPPAVPIVHAGGDGAPSAHSDTVPAMSVNSSI
mmetsp:Transcript_35037/g.112864  ORF Transcript_35037/g.112864 Transcript_35037/m.112864 type:complete len:229 (-) Transcript_35037:66-752(-)